MYTVSLLIIHLFEFHTRKRLEKRAFGIKNKEKRVCLPQTFTDNLKPKKKSCNTQAGSLNRCQSIKRRHDHKIQSVFLIKSTTGKKSPAENKGTSRHYFPSRCKKKINFTSFYISTNCTSLKLHTVLLKHTCLIINVSQSNGCFSLKQKLHWVYDSLRVLSQCLVKF